MTQPAPGQQAEAMTVAVQTSYRHVQAGGLPFVAVLALADGTVSEPGTNKVAATGDPTAHAEIVAIRSLMDRTRRPHLAGTTLLATGEPCAMCYRFAAAHHVEHVSYAVDQDTAAAWGFDYRTPQGSPPRLQHTSEHLPTPGALEPFRLFHRLHQPNRPTPEELP